MSESPCCQAPLVLFRTLNYKKCAECKTDYPWDLDEGQAPLVTDSRDKSTMERKDV